MTLVAIILQHEDRTMAFHLKVTFHDTFHHFDMPKWNKDNRIKFKK